MAGIFPLFNLGTLRNVKGEKYVQGFRVKGEKKWFTYKMKRGTSAKAGI